MRPRLQALERPEPLGDRVYTTLREYLRAGRIPAGQPLQEAALAAQLGVSRTPVREALARLATDGLVVAEGRSFMLPELTVADIEDIYALRFLLEPEALRLAAASRPDKKQLAPLRKALDAMAAANEAGDGAGFMEANYRYRDAWTVLKGLKRLVLALAAGDGDAAAQAMQSHLENAKRILLGLTGRS
jgi:DNA-binding GntR family transcriptional regulator